MRYLHSLKLSEKVLYYGSSQGKDYLLSRKIQGEDGTHPDYLSEPQRLCDITASLLRKLHEMDGSSFTDAKCAAEEGVPLLKKKFFFTAIIACPILS